MIRRNSEDWAEAAARAARDLERLFGVGLRRSSMSPETPVTSHADAPDRPGQTQPMPPEYPNATPPPLGAPPSRLSGLVRDFRSPNAERGASLCAGEWRIGPLARSFATPRRAFDAFSGPEALAGLNLHAFGDGAPRASPASDVLYDYAHSFAWLRDLAPVERGTGHALALAQCWFERFGRSFGPEWTSGRTADRLFALLAWGGPALAANDPDLRAGAEECVIRSAGLLAERLERNAGPIEWREALALALAGAALRERHQWLALGLAAVEASLAANILADGGHVSRNPETLAELFLDLAAFEEFLLRSGVSAPPGIGKTAQRVAAFLHFLREPDGGLPILQGAREGDRQAITAALSRYDAPARKFAWTRLSALHRVDSPFLTALIDAGGPPPPPFDDRAHAQSLSFSLSSPGGRMVTACGAPVWAPPELAKALRFTDAHSGLSVAGEDSAPLRASRGETENAAYAPVPGLSARRLEEPDDLWVEVQHDGWRERFGLIHRRRIYAHRHSAQLRGEDALFRALNDGVSPITALIPFMIRFHLHPDCAAAVEANGRSVRLTLPNGEVWRFKSSAPTVDLSDTYYYASGERRRKSRQITISGAADPNGSGESGSNLTTWAFTRLNAAGTEAND